ncbi:hypothetical protein PGT21_006742 [Puccinia graminis f. sp. tritici]|uniref:Uncharacterized protein n=1 Tax=Puccinia graminis f. sp. tritici TaxID=56615 RepID=A0A5B0N0E6_PUCGR|nr:hypothetical protein PGT21_006742 [Puccinia graminis f. sp. tritici]KAA1082262.1 hypothetical protein PGTUg99_030384 [Puccinia graminis f. sp. tritici]
MPRSLAGIIVLSALSYALPAPIYDLPITTSSSGPYECPAISIPVKQSYYSEGIEPINQAFRDETGHYSSNPQVTMKPPEYLPMVHPECIEPTKVDTNGKRDPTDDEKKKIADILKNYPPGYVYKISRSRFYVQMSKPIFSSEYSFGRVRILGADDKIIHDTGCCHYNCNSVTHGCLQILGFILDSMIAETRDDCKHNE